MWSSVNRVLDGAFDLFLWPFQSLPAALQVLALAIPATIVALLAFRYTSDQAGITRTKNLIKAHLLELRLFKDDFRVIARAQGAILRNSLRYMRYGIAPMAVMIIPFLIVLVQVESRFAYSGMEPGKSVILSVKVDEAQSPSVSQLDAVLVLPPNMRSETPALRIDSSGEIFWRLASDRPGRYGVGIRLGNETVTKQLVVGAGSGRASPALYRSDDWRAFGWPGEPSMVADSMAESVHVNYPRGRSQFAGLSSASWLLFGLCLVLGFLLRGFFKVTF